MRYRHLIVFFSNGGVITTEPRLYARANQDLFEEFDFSDSQNNHPTTSRIILELQNQGFRTEVNEVYGVKIHYRFD